MGIFKKYKFFIIFSILSCLILILFALYTSQAWDDFFITLRYSKNLAEGKGAVYNTGERVYGFTSPLEMLLLSFSYLITGKSSYLPALWIYRLISIAAFIAAGILLLLSIPDNGKKKSPAAYLLAALYLLETKSIVFSASGMESAFTLLFISLFIFLASRDLLGNWIGCGISWAGLLFARPDGCVYIFCLSLGYLIFSATPRKKTFIALLKAAFVCALLYLPWFIWAWSYYGSPIPNTVLAKARLIMFRPPLSILNCIFGPVYIYFGGWPIWINMFTASLGLLAAFYWTVPSKDRVGRALSFSFLLLYIYYTFLPRYPWYYPPVAAISLIVLVNSVFTVKNSSKAAAAAISAAICAGMLYILLSTSLQLRIQHKEIEKGNRMEIGLWLKENVLPGETVYLEPLGYIGYFSGSRMIDYPGLVSEKMVRLLRKDKSINFYTAIPHFDPKWILLRPYETAFMSKVPYFNYNYEFVRSFDVSKRIDSYKHIPGRPYLLYDSAFLLFKKK
ncbi:MAG: hypothetical protein WC301_05390 [Candidatus Omnitrophota bacterium]|jgi:hypothetical protein